MKLNISDTPDKVLAELAQYFASCAQEAIAKNGRFSVVLSGGNSPKKLHELLVNQYRDKIEWEKVWFFFGDERDVPLNDSQSNYLMAKQTLFDPLDINPEHIFPVETALGAKEAARHYTLNLHSFFEGQDICFDLIILGLGDNSHTASLFPHTAVLVDESVSVQALYIDEVKMNRITFTAPLINKAKHVAFLVYGNAKAEAVKHILEDPKDTELYPAQLISSANDVQWFLDRAAAQKLRVK